MQKKEHIIVFKLMLVFAAKEACAKALGTGIQEGIKWKDIEIKNDNRGEPFICLSGLAQASASNKEISNIRGKYLT